MHYGDLKERKSSVLVIGAYYLAFFAATLWEGMLCSKDGFSRTCFRLVED